MSNDQDSIEVDYSKTKNNDRSYLQDPITKCNYGSNTQKITTEDISASVFLELQSQRVIHEPHDDLKTNFVLLENTEELPK